MPAANIVVDLDGQVVELIGVDRFLSREVEIVLPVVCERRGCIRKGIEA